MQEVPLSENIRSGQRETAEKFYEKTLVVSKLPTGYGKTATAAISYEILRANNIANRVLYVVPRGNQAKQAAGSFPSWLRRSFGTETDAHVVSENPIRAQRAHLNDTAEVFVLTIQSLVSSPATIKVVKEMLSKGRWFVVIDEYHHYSVNGENDYGKWVEAIKSLPSEAMLAMSATPRMDGKDYFGEPDVAVAYLDACKAGMVKEMHLHHYEYQVDMVDGDGEVSTFSTGDVADMFGGTPEAIDEEVARKKMRWSPKYISPLILVPAERMANLRANGIRSQMIVQAMSCTHADMVCQQIKALLPTLNVDWVGTGKNGRTDKDNARIIDAFCPEEDASGKRCWELDVLVNVGMAGEGLDTKDCTEVVVLTPGNITVSLLQLFGRGSRVMSLPPGMTQPRCHISVDTDTVVARDEKYLGKRVMAIFDEEIDPDDIEDDETKDKTEDEYEEIPDELLVYIADVRLVDIKTDPNYAPLIQELEAKAKWSQEEAEVFAEDFLRKAAASRDEKLNATAREAQAKTQIDGALSKVVGLVLRRMAEIGLRPEKTMAADLKRRINTAKKRHVGRAVKEADEDELATHYQFLKHLEQAILKDHGLQGIPSWLR
jgi:superfamily II DNA or RNA helicase